MALVKPCVGYQHDAELVRRVGLNHDLTVLMNVLHLLVHKHELQFFLNVNRGTFILTLQIAELLKWGVVSKMACLGLEGIVLNTSKKEV